MKLLKSILGRVFALWAAVVFISSLLLIVIPVWLISFQSEPKRTKNAFKFFNPWLAFFFFCTGVKRIYKGRKHFDNNENFIVVCNHRSFLDPPMVSPGIPEPNKTIAKIEMAKIPVFGVIYKAGSVLVDRKNALSRKNSYMTMKRTLKIGLHMCIFPEGTRNKTNEPLQRFQDGAFRLAEETGKRIIPAVLFNTDKVLPTNRKFFFWPQKVEMHFLPPVDVSGKPVDEIREEVYTLMDDYYQQHTNGKSRRKAVMV